MQDADASEPAAAEATTEAEAHEGEIDIGEPEQIGAPDSLGPLYARFVRYPGCQQICLHLPQPGHLGYTQLRIAHAEGTCIDHAPVRERLNGSVQLLWDTLAWPPGSYSIEIDHQDGWSHRLALHKRLPGRPGPAPVALPEGVNQDHDNSADTKPIVYRDGFGRVLPDLDLEMRSQANASLARQFHAAAYARLAYSGNFRSGVITYIEPTARIEFPHEMGGGACRFYIEIPTVEQWQAATRTPLSRRDEILTFVALTVQRDQCSTWNFEIKSDVIRFT